MRVAINGMGRIGRLLFRRLMDHPSIEVVAINDLMDVQNLIYLLKYDSVYGPLPLSLMFENKLLVGNKSVTVLNEADPKQLSWNELQVDVVIECTGQFTKKSLATQHLSAGAKRVLLSTTGSEDIPLMIFGFNEKSYNKEIDVISPGGCMTNCSVQVINALSSLHILSAQLNVVHSYTSRQSLVDAPHKDFRRGRAAAESIIPVPVDLAQSLERLFPALTGKIAAVTTRVPVLNGALADFTFHVADDINKEDVNALLKKAASEHLSGIIAYVEDPLVSLDIKGNAHSAVIDGTLTSVVGNQVKVFAFFDNEYGFTSRMIDWLMYVK